MDAIASVSHHFSSGVYAKEICFPAGSSGGKHVHDFDHLSILAAGTVKLSVDGVETIITAPHCVTVMAGKAHVVTAVTDAVWYCIHATDETDPDEVDQALIEKGGR